MGVDIGGRGGPGPPGPGYGPGPAEDVPGAPGGGPGGVPSGAQGWQTLLVLRKLRSPTGGIWTRCPFRGAPAWSPPGVTGRSGPPRTGTRLPPSSPRGR
ncbi:MAG: hypothetical protein C4291_14810 [Candidatus Dadabacteria bacterium]